MLSKLLKYDLKYMIKNMFIFYILSVFFAFTTRILFSLNQTVIIKVLGQISVGFMFSMLGSILFNTIIRSWVRFKESIYKDESYLTHTLPVSKTQIYESRFLQSIIFTFVSFIVIVISLFITYYTNERWELIKTTIKALGNGLNINVVVVIVFIIVILFLEIINIIQSGFLGTIIGFRKYNNKIGKSFFFGVAVYLLSQAFVLFLTLISGLFNNKILDIFIKTTFDNSILKTIMVLCSIFYIIVIIIMNMICNYSLKKGVNVE